MAAMTAKAKEEIQIRVQKNGIAEVAIRGDQVAEITPDGNVTTFADKGVQLVMGPAVDPATNDASIDIGEAFNTVAIYGTKLELAKDGHLIVAAKGMVFTAAPVNVAALKTEKDALDIGDKMADGTVYAGISPTTGKQMFALPDDEFQTMSWRKAMRVAKRLNAHGHDDWRLPTADELNILFRARKRGAFKDNLSGSYGGGWYWSSTTRCGFFAKDQRFIDGERGRNRKGFFGSSVRLVRS